MNNDEQLKLVDIEPYKGRIYGLDKDDKCPHCHNENRFTVDKDWKPPDGIDEKMIKVKCVLCDKEYYLIGGKK